MTESSTPFRMRLPSADYFAGLVKAISAVVDEGSFTADKESLKLVGMDPAHVSMVNFVLGRDAAEEYSCEQPTEIRLNIPELLKFLKRAGSESLTLEYDETARKLRLVLSNATARKERTFVLNTLESASSPTPVPRLSFEARCRVDTSAFYEAVNDAALVSDYTRITITPNYLMLSSKSDLGLNQTKLEKDGSLVHEISTDKEVSASFSLTYLEKIVSSSRQLSAETGIELSTNKPIKLAFPITAGKIEFLIAPRME
ncbi:MAG: proliferating cell nuclear antigen (pcna) [Candidatus Caldarchaeum sp.]